MCHTDINPVAVYKLIIRPRVMKGAPVLETIVCSETQGFIFRQ